MKKLLLLLILFISTNAFSQEIKKEERDNLSNQIFDSLTESERKKAFIEIIGLDDFAIDKSTQQHPDPNDFEAQFNQ